MALSSSRVLRLAIGLAVLVALTLAWRTLPLGPWFVAFQAWVRTLGPTGWLVYIVVYAASCVLLVPALALTIGAGAIYGFAAGVAIVVAGATLGASAAFLLARTVLRPRIEAIAAADGRYAALDRAIARDGARIVFLVRLAPVFPFTWVNYLFGLTAVPFSGYVLATVIGILPGTAVFVWLSATAAAAAAGTASHVRVAMNVTGAIVAIAVSVWVGRIAARAIRQAER